VLGRFHADDYEPTALTEEPDTKRGTLLALNLVARDQKSPFPRARLLVQPRDFRAVQIELWLPSGKPASVVEFTDWEKGMPRRLLVSVTVQVLRMEERPLDPSVFALEDAAARASLPPPLPAEGRP
jgi:hypothetical protein